MNINVGSLSAEKFLTREDLLVLLAWECAEISEATARRALSTSHPRVAHAALDVLRDLASSRGAAIAHDRINGRDEGGAA